MPHGVTIEPKTRPRVGREEARKRIVDAAIELVRERSFSELTVGEIMDRAGLERTVFYRHFENVGALLLGAGREAINQLYAAQVALAETRVDHGPENVRQALEVPVRIYQRHGPLLRAVSEAVGAAQLVAADQETLRRSFDDLTVRAIEEAGVKVADPAETARALNLLTESYLLDAFGREPRVSTETATETLTEIWSSLVSAKQG